MKTLKKISQKQRLLEMFSCQNTWSNFELRSLQPPIFQYPVRIKELIQEGHDIRGYWDKNVKKKYNYTIYQKGELFPIAKG